MLLQHMKQHKNDNSYHECQIGLFLETNVSETEGVYYNRQNSVPQMSELPPAHELSERSPESTYAKPAFLEKSGTSIPPAADRVQYDDIEHFQNQQVCVFVQSCVLQLILQNV